MGSSSGYIYFVKPQGSSVVKIGFSTDPDKRLRSLQLMNHTPLKIVAKIKATQRDEQWLHQELKAYRVRGEWFRLSSFEVFRAVFIARCLNAGVEPDMEKFLDWADRRLSEGAKGEPPSNDLGDGVLGV